MIYIRRPGDAFQHLATDIERGALCGAQSSSWHTGNIPARHFTGVPLCSDCKAARARIKAQAKEEQRRKEALEVIHFWKGNLR